jgi:mRNA interferase YafQ
MYKIYTTNRFEKDLKLCKKRNYDLNLLKKGFNSQK